MTEKDIKFLQLLAEEIKLHSYNAQAKRLDMIIDKESNRLDCIVIKILGGRS